MYDIVIQNAGTEFLTYIHHRKPVIMPETSMLNILVIKDYDLTQWKVQGNMFIFATCSHFCHFKMQYGVFFSIEWCLHSLYSWRIYVSFGRIPLLADVIAIVT